jgi:hypothetical protein
VEKIFGPVPIVTSTTGPSELATMSSFSLIKLSDLGLIVLSGRFRTRKNMLPSLIKPIDGSAC